MIELTLCKRTTIQRTSIEEIHSHMEQLRPISNLICVIPSNPTTTFSVPANQHIIELITKPLGPAYIGDMLKYPLKSEWKTSLFKNYDKNHCFGLFSCPFLRADLLPNTKVHKTTIGFCVKSTDLQGCYNLSSRTCLNGAKMIKEINYSKSYSLVVHADNLRLILAIRAAQNLYFLPDDIMNSF